MTKVVISKTVEVRRYAAKCSVCGRLGPWAETPTAAMKDACECEHWYWASIDTGMCSVCIAKKVFCISACVKADKHVDSSDEA